MKSEAGLSIAESDGFCVICLQKPSVVKTKYCHNDYDRGRLLFARQYLLEHLTMLSSRSAKAISGSTIQNSAACR